MNAPTPASLGYRMPAEWQPHRRCWMIWPGAESVSHADLAPARAAYAAVAAAIARFEPVAMLTNPADADTARAALGAGITVVEGASNDCWMRDTGPSFLLGPGGALAGTDWRFNAYGGNYAPFDLDQGIAGRVMAESGARSFSCPLVCEGGAVHVDGEGTVLTTEDVLLNPNRNPGLTRDEAGRLLCAYLGAETVIWLEHGLVQDTDTDGHIDTVSCFTGPGRVLAQVSADRSDPNHGRLAGNLARLKSARDAQGRRLEVAEVVEPRAMVVGGARLSLSYVNFYPANGAVIVPVFDVPEDAPALAVIADCFPGREVVPVPAVEVFRGGGGVHCITQQEPRAGG